MHDGGGATGLLDAADGVGLQLGRLFSRQLDLERNEVSMDATQQIGRAGGGELRDVEFSQIASRKRLAERFLDATLQTGFTLGCQLGLQHAA